VCVHRGECVRVCMNIFDCTVSKKRKKKARTSIIKPPRLTAPGLQRGPRKPLRFERRRSICAQIHIFFLSSILIRSLAISAPSWIISDFCFCPPDWRFQATQQILGNFTCGRGGEKKKTNSLWATPEVEVRLPGLS
jgi:hypothetical protein